MNKEKIDLTEKELEEWEPTANASINSGLMYEIVMKPVVNFSSVEIRVNVPDYMISEAMGVFKYVYKELKDTCSSDVAEPKYAGNAAKKKEKEFVPPTERQLEIMDRFKIEYDEYTTQEEARALINKSMNRGSAKR